MIRRSIILTLLAALAPFALRAAIGQDQSPPTEAPNSERRLEADREPPILLEAGPIDRPSRDKAHLVSPAMKSMTGSFVSNQANVNALGENVRGDAANEPSIAVDPTAPNRIAVGWRQFNSVSSNFRQAGYSYSVDGGRTWAARQIIEPGIFRSDPVLEAGPDGTFYYLSLSIDPFPGGDYLNDLFVSTDGGATWPTKSFAYGGDKSWLAIDSTGGIGHGQMYQAWNTAGNIYFPNQFSRSPDSGVNWEFPIQYPPAAQPVFGILDVGPDGEVYIAGSNNSADAGTFWVVKSSNARDELVTPIFEQVTTLDLGGHLRIGTGPNPNGLLGQVNVAVDKSSGPSRGNVYVLGSVDPQDDDDPMDVMFIRSVDGGATFSAPVRINDDPTDTDAWQWFGTMSVAPNGRLDVIWNDTRASGLANISELYYSSSSDAGVTWSPNVVLGAPFDSFVGWPNQNKIGDYYDMVSDNLGANLIYAATYNGEQDVYYLRIGDYDCNQNDVADGDDLALGTSPDCNANGIPDECELAAGASLDENVNGIPDECDKTGDLDGDGEVGVPDLLDLLGQWGPCSDELPAPPCPADLDDNGLVNVVDLLTLLGNWG